MTLRIFTMSALQRALAAGAAVVLCSAPALAQQQTTVLQQNGTEYVTGGIGEGDEERTKSLGKDMGLQAVFARADGSYVSGVDVKLKDASGKTVLELDAAKPLLFADLAPGRYELVATYRGDSQRRSVQVPKSGQRVAYLRWKSPEPSAATGATRR